MTNDKSDDALHVSSEGASGAYLTNPAGIRFQETKHECVDCGKMVAHYVCVCEAGWQGPKRCAKCFEEALARLREHDRKNEESHE